MKIVCVDANFLIGLYDEKDSFHSRAAARFEQLFSIAKNRLLIPWPILYETISTKMVKNRSAMLRLEADWRRLSTQRRLDLLSDSSFREGLIDECFSELGRPKSHYRTLSAVDRVIRRMLSDKNLRIQAFVTFNPKDFGDVCKRFGTELLC